MIRFNAGKTASTLAKAIGSVSKTARLSAGLAKGARLTKIGGTSFTLGYVEGAMSAAEVYKNSYDQLGNEFDPQTGLVYSDDKRRRFASDAAAVTAQTNTVMIGLLNLTSVAPLFVGIKNLRRANQMGLNRARNKATGAYTETVDQWKKRLKTIIDDPKAGITSPLKKILLRESLQEGTEEVSNLYAETRGRQYAGLEDDPYKDVLFDFGTFIDKAFSEEGALNFVLGALGGIGQTAGMHGIPMHKVAKRNSEK